MPIEGGEFDWSQPWKVGKPIVARQITLKWFGAWHGKNISVFILFNQSFWSQEWFQYWHLTTQVIKGVSYLQEFFHLYFLLN